MADMLKFLAYLDTVSLIPGPASMADTGGRIYVQMEAFSFKNGIWESQNASRQMFGKKRFRDLIRAHALKPAEDILHSVITGLDEFRHPLEKEDDVTLVVIKVTS